MAYTHSLMLAETNQFKFTCPIFNAEVQARICFKLHDRFMVGQPHEKRRGCAACMTANKCPIPHMIREQTRDGETRYFSETAKAGRLSPAVIERVQPLMVLDSILANYAVPDSERAAIQSATGILGEKTGRRTVEVGDVDDIAPAPKTRKAKAKAPEKDEAVTRAAATGDMSEALTRAAAKPHKSLIDRIPPEKREEIAEKIRTQDEEPVADGDLSKPKPKAPTPPKKGMSLLELAKARKEAAA